MLERAHVTSLILFILFVIGAGAPAAVCASTERVTVKSGGAQIATDNHYLDLSGDGRFIAFVSADPTIVPGDTNGAADVFVRDLVTGVTARASVRADGVEANDHCHQPHLSHDGRFVVFSSFGSNLAPSDQNGSTTDVFVKDMLTGALEHVSVSSISAGGVGGDGISAYSSISADGRFTTFFSYATNLVSGDTNGVRDVFLHDRQTGVTERVSVDANGSQMPHGGIHSSVSGDGARVAFEGWTVNGTPVVWLRERVIGTTTLVSAVSGQPFVAKWPILSADGSTLAVTALTDGVTPDDEPFLDESFTIDLTTGAWTRVSVPAPGGVAGHAITTSLSADGRWAAFSSSAPFVPADTNGATDVYLFDRLLGSTELVSVGDVGQQPARSGGFGLLSADGRQIGFSSDSGNLVASDSNGAWDGFIRDRCGSGGFSSYGAGVAGSGGAVPALIPSVPPRIGHPFTLSVTNSSGAPIVATLLIGATAAAAPTPFGGHWLVDPIFVAPVPLGLTGAAVAASIPNEPSLCGVPVFLQSIVPDAGAPAGIALSAGLALSIGG